MFRRVVLDEILPTLPEISDFNSAIEAVEQVDLLVCVNGFEERSTAVVNRLVGLGANVENVLVVRYGTNKVDNNAMYGELLVGLGALTANVKQITELSSNIELRAAIADSLPASTQVQQRVVVDLSVASSRLILRIVRVLFELARARPLLSCLIVYSSAEIYMPTRDMAADIVARTGENAHDRTLGLDSDADEYLPTTEYPGQHIEHVPDRAIVICGFNANRVRAALNHIDPAFNVDPAHPRVVYLVGIPPKAEDRWRLNAMIEIHGISDEHPTPRVVSTLDYRDTLRTLEAEYEGAFGAERLTVLPFGSKMQTLAAALFCELHPDVRAQTVAPAEYHGSMYSRGTEGLYMLDFGVLQEVSASMRQLGTLRLLESE